jgi:serine/threonine-protein kinase HipA
MSNVLDVLLYDQKIGTITLLPNDSTMFVFENSYITNAQRPALSQSFIKPTGELITETRPYRIKLPPFFSNLLPEGAMRNYLAERGGVKPEREFHLLRVLGDDLSGAITIKDSAANPATNPNLDAVDHHPKAPDIYHFSLAGVQLKFSALMRKGGLTIPAHGVGGDWIVKLPSAQFSYVPENEHAMMRLAEKVGIQVPETRLVPIENITGLPDLGVLQGKQAVAVKRFDRTEDGQKIHIEDFAQVYTVFPDDKYEKVSYRNIAQMIWTLTGEEGLSDFIRRLTFIILTGNGDMHLKNWSFIYNDPRKPELSPAYDLVSTIPYLPKDGLALKFVDTKDMQEVDISAFERLVRKADLPEYPVMNTVKETVQKTLTVWNEEKAHYDLPSDIQDRIDEHMAKTALAKSE